MTTPVRSRSIEARDAKLRSGAGKHGDRRLKRLKTRKAQKAQAFRDQA